MVEQIEVRDGPLTLSTPMVIATLAGLKDTTRRVIVPQYPGMSAFFQGGVQAFDEKEEPVKFIKCPYGKVGDRLWIRETWAVDNHFILIGQKTILVAYKAGPPAPNSPIVLGIMEGAKQMVSVSNSDYEKYSRQKYRKWQSSRFMPKIFTRLHREITEIKVGRVRDITEEEARREGVESSSFDGGQTLHYRLNFATLWDKLNKKRGYGWDSNCWVWVVRSKEVKL